jgi:hypothetical protein
MSRKTSSTLLIERLRTLLEERRSLRSLFPRYRMFVDLRNFTSERTELENQIAQIISAGFNEQERHYMPQAAHIAECAFHLRASFSTASLLEQPALVWNHNPLPGVLTTHWEPGLKQRLLDLCGPLDATLERMLAQ